LQYQVRKAVIPAAGMGTRFLPVSKSIPKEMLPLVDRPSIQYVVEEAANSGIDEILLVTARNKSSMEDHFDRHFELESTLEKKGKKEELNTLLELSSLAHIYSVRQKEPLGLGHAVLCAREFVGSEPFAVLLGDDIVYSKVPCIQQLAEVYQEKRAAVLGVQEVDVSHTGKYGIVDSGGKDGNPLQVSGVVEKPSPEEAPGTLAVMGRYILEPAIFDVLDRTPPGAGGEIQLTDALNEIAKSKKVWAYSFTGRRYDVGDKLGYLKATLEFALRREDLGEEFRDYLKNLHLE